MALDLRGCEMNSIKFNVLQGLTFRARLHRADEYRVISKIAVPPSLKDLRGRDKGSHRTAR